MVWFVDKTFCKHYVITSLLVKEMQILSDSQFQYTSNQNQFRTFGHSTLFYAPGLKGPPGASSNLSVRPSVRLSVCLSLISSRLQTKCNILSLGDDTVTRLGL